MVIVTSLGEEDDRQRGIDAGADAYIVKRSFDQHDLLETVERLVGPMSDRRPRAGGSSSARTPGPTRPALARLLEREREIEVVGVCATAEEAIARLSQSLKPDLVTMDLELPGMSGVEAIEQIMSAQPVPILVLSAHVEQRLADRRSPPSPPARSTRCPRTASTSATPTARGRRPSAGA